MMRKDGVLWQEQISLVLVEFTGGLEVLRMSIEFSSPYLERSQPQKAKNDWQVALTMKTTN
jgi:hypothetical protein